LYQALIDFFTSKDKMTMDFFISSNKGVCVNFVLFRGAKVMKSIVFCSLFFSLTASLFADTILNFAQATR